MTKEMLINFMQDWPNETIIEISASPFVCYINGIYIDPKNGKGYICAPPEWYIK